MKRLRIRQYKGEEFGTGLLILGAAWLLSFLFLGLIFDRAWIAFMAVIPVFVGGIWMIWLGITMIYDSIELTDGKD